MFLQLDHHKMDVYVQSRAFVKECCFVTKNFPSEEKFAVVQQNPKSSSFRSSE